MDITVNHLTHTFDGQTLFADLSFEIRSGRRFRIAGPSGSGKSTLLKILAGLAVPTSGDIAIGSDRLTEASVWTLRNRIAYVSQEPELGTGPVIDRLRRPFEYHANAHLRWDREKVTNCFEQFRLDEKLLDKDVSELSGGEKQRIAIIIALLLQRPILLLDEPVSALDADLKEIVKAEFLRDASRTILFISHETALLEIADDTIKLTAAGVEQ